jgi:hypothetical protein
MRESCELHGSAYRRSEVENPATRGYYPAPQFSFIEADPFRLVAVVSEFLVPEFDEETHTFKLDGKPIPSVTTVINGILGNNPFWTDAGRDSGTATHRAIQFYSEGDLDYDSLDEATKPRFGAYVKFCNDMQFKPDITEQPMARRNPFYAGIPDQIQLGRVVVDFKNGGHDPRHGIQIAAYAQFLSNPYIHERWVVWLKEDGKYDLKVYPKTSFGADWAIFQNMLNIFNWKGIHGI